MGGKLGVTPPVRIQQPATCISTNETLILERVTQWDRQPCCKHCDFFLTLNMIPCYGIHLTAFCSRSDFQTSLVEILYFPPMSMWWQLQLIISENLRNFGDESWNSNWRKVKDEVFWSDAPSTWLHLTIRRRSVDAVFRPVRIVTRRSKGRSGGPRCTPPPPGQLSRTQPCLLLPWNKYLMTSQPHFLWS